jgi:[ribosomal protein S5]-alanine N-acetyltransferase
VKPRVPEWLDTPRLRLRRPAAADARALFQRYGSDPEVTRLLGWARHERVSDAEAFVGWSDLEWATHGAGPYLAFERGGRLVGATGLQIETAWRASTGYALARDAWGQGYATELALAMVQAAFAIAKLERLYALCHATHAASARVLEKAGFEREGLLRRHTLFPNLDPPGPHDVLLYARVR